MCLRDLAIMSRPSLGGLQTQFISVNKILEGNENFEDEISQVGESCNIPLVEAIVYKYRLWKQGI